MSTQQVYLLRKEVELLRAENKELKADYADAQKCIGDMQSKWESLFVENNELRKCCTQRGARMQIMREWMDSKHGLGPPTEWWYFVEERPGAARWFDEDGVPK